MSLYRHKFELKNGKTVTIRNPEPEDAAGVIESINTVDTETVFLAREPGEFDVTEEHERELLAEWRDDVNTLYLVAEIDGKIIGTCIAMIKPRVRCRHRSSLSIALMKEFWGLGIGRRMLDACIAWSIDRGCTKIELSVDTENTRAIKLYESVGLEIQCVVKNQRRMLDGSYRDEYMMAMFLDQ